MKRYVLCIIGFSSLISVAQNSYRKALDFIDANQLEDAEKVISHSFGNDTMSKDFLFLSGKVYRKKGSYERALKCFENIIYIDSSYSRAYGEISVINAINGNYEFAIKYADLAISFNPNDVELLNNRGAVYYLISNYEAALKDYEKALQFDPNDDYALYNAGITLIQLKKYDQAITSFSKALQRRPNNGKIHMDLGKAYYLNGDFENAIKDFKKALKYYDTENDYEYKTKNKSELFYQLAICYKQLGNDSEYEKYIFEMNKNNRTK